MIIPIKWLKEFIDVKNADEVIGILLKAGFESVKIQNAENFKGVVAAQVLKVTDIPGTGLKNCLVSDGRELCSVVCGAPNVDKGQLVAFARAGAELPGGVKISKKKIRGVMSNGMICSEKELGIGDDALGITVLKENLPLGAPLTFKKEESVDVEITANRGDCLSIYGIAREISFFSGKKLLNPPEFPEITQDQGTPPDFSIIREDDNCPLYRGCLIQGVTVSPSPAWIKEKISSLGLNPQNNIVDITNLMLFEFGQPMHAFDAGLITSKKIRISPSQKGEKIKLLDGTDYSLSENICLIRNDTEPVAVGGVMGGEKSGISPSTASIFLESAYFLPEAVYRASRIMGVATPSSMRFARGVDGIMVKKALMMAVHLIKETAGANSKVAGFFKEGKLPGRTPLMVRKKCVSSLLGTDVSADVMTKCLAQLGGVQSNEEGVFELLPNSWRNDLNIEEDVAEEIARFIGYENIPPRYPRIRRLPYGLPEGVMQRNSITGKLISSGFNEVITSDMISERKLFQKFTDVVRIKNPVSTDMGVLRPTLFVGLAEVFRRNVAHGLADIRIFESGSVFKNTSSGASFINEEELIAGMASGGIIPLSHYDCGEVDFFYVKGVLESVVRGFVKGFSAISAERINSPFLKNSFIFFRHGGKEKEAPQTDGRKNLPFFLIGEVPSEILNSFDIKKDYLTSSVVYFELYYKNFCAPASVEKKEYKAPPAVPAVQRDISVVVDESKKFSAVLEAVEAARPKYLYDIRLLDVYRGEQIEKGKKSVSLRLFFRGEGTLLQTDVDKEIASVLAILSENLQAVLREK